MHKKKQDYELELYRAHTPRAPCNSATWTHAVDDLYLCRLCVRV